jgi:hypothetical protein
MYIFSTTNVEIENHKVWDKTFKIRINETIWILNFRTKIIRRDLGKGARGPVFER